MRTHLLSSILPAALLGSACGSSAGDAGSAKAAGGDAGAAAPASTTASKVDACALVTAAEAAALFGEPATRDAGVTVTDPNMIGECIWEHETPAGSHQLQVRVWASPQYYNPPADEFTTPLDVGERGYVRSHSASGVDVAWVQGGRVYELSYFTIGGAGFPKATSRVESVKELAGKTAGEI
jgi:hypothetical protein